PEGWRCGRPRHRIPAGPRGYKNPGRAAPVATVYGDGSPATQGGVMTTAALGSVLRCVHRLDRRLELARLGDGDLLARFCRGRDEPAFDELLRRHGPMVRAVCRRLLGHCADADDAFQATFL